MASGQLLNWQSFFIIQHGLIYKVVERMTKMRMEFQLLRVKSHENLYFQISKSNLFTKESTGPSKCSYCYTE